MNIVVVDVAAEKTGALSILLDFYNYVKEHPQTDIEWFFLTSVVHLDETEHIHVIQERRIKKNWIHRLWWEYHDFGILIKRLDSNAVLSLQNKSLPIKGVPQAVYFHNALHLLKKHTFSFFDRYERAYSIYNSLVTPITMYSLKHCDLIITQTNTMKTALENKLKNKRVICIPPAIKTTPKKDNNVVKGFIYPCSPLVYKKHELIIDALKKCKQYNGEILFTFSESDNEYARKIAVLSKGISNIKFIGFQEREKLLELYCEYGLIFSSDVESFPIPFAEAMAYGAPIISRNMAYAREILANYKNVEYFSNSDELAALLQMSRNASRGEPYSININSPWERVVSSIEEISR